MENTNELLNVFSCFWIRHVKDQQMKTCYKDEKSTQHKKQKLISKRTVTHVMP